MSTESSRRSWRFSDALYDKKTPEPNEHLLATMFRDSAISRRKRSVEDNIVETAGLVDVNIALSIVSVFLSALSVTLAALAYFAPR